MEIEQFGDWKKISKIDGVKAFKDDASNKWYYHINEKVIDLQNFIRVCGPGFESNIEAIREQVLRFTSKNQVNNPYTVEKLLIEAGHQFDFTGKVYEITGDFVERFERKHDYVYHLIDHHDIRRVIQVELPRDIVVVEESQDLLGSRPGSLLNRRVCVTGRLVTNEWTAVPTIKAMRIADLDVCTRQKEEQEIEKHSHLRIYTSDTQNNFRSHPPKNFHSIGLIAGKEGKGYHDFKRILAFGKYHFRLHERNVKIENIPEVIQAIKNLRTDNKCDCICIIRGGGHPERLHLYWDKDLLTEIYCTQEKYKIPVITGIGHESDHPFCEKVAMYAAATPTDAAYFFNEVAEYFARKEKMRASIPKGVIGMGVPSQRDIRDEEIAMLKAKLQFYKHSVEQLQQQIDDLKGL